MTAPNYVILINGLRTYEADTAEEAWDIIGRQPFGTRYEVTSPTGLNVFDFIPY